MPERFDRREEREFGEFQGPLRSSCVGALAVILRDGG